MAIPSGEFAKHANPFFTRSLLDIPEAMAMGPWSTLYRAPAGEKLRHFIPAYLKNLGASTVGGGIPMLLGLSNPAVVAAGSIVGSGLSSMKSLRLARAAAAEKAMADYIRQQSVRAAIPLAAGTVGVGALGYHALSNSEEVDQPQLTIKQSSSKTADVAGLLKRLGLVGEAGSGGFLGRLGISSPLGKLLGYGERAGSDELDRYNRKLFGAGSSVAEGAGTIGRNMGLDMDKLFIHEQPKGNPFGAFYASDRMAKDVKRVFDIDMPLGKDMLHLPGSPPSAPIAAHELGHAWIHDLPGAAAFEGVSTAGLLANPLLGIASIFPSNKATRQKINRLSMAAFLPRFADEVGASILGTQSLLKTLAESGLDEATQQAIMRESTPMLEGALGTYAALPALTYKGMGAVGDLLNKNYGAPRITSSPLINEALGPLTTPLKNLFERIKPNLPEKSFYDRLLHGSTSQGPNYTGSAFT